MKRRMALTLALSHFVGEGIKTPIRRNGQFASFPSPIPMGET